MQRDIHINVTDRSTVQSLKLQSMIDSQQTDHSLARPFYTSSDIYKLDLACIWEQNWIWAGHTSQVKSAGDYFVFEFGFESVIVVRDTNGALHAHQNVCRHRGSRVCVEAHGNTRSFTCPYHAWTYDLQGQLRSSRLMPDAFRQQDHGLQPVNVEIFQGLIFICLSDTPPPIDAALEKLNPLMAPFAIDNTRVAHQANYTVQANWKLALENYLECYHCAPAHRDYAKSHSLKDPDAVNEQLTRELAVRSALAGLPTGEFSETAEAAEHHGTDVYYRRYPLYEGYVTGSKTGKPLAPLLGELNSFDGGATDIQIGILNFFLAYSDHIVGYRFIPRDLQTTDIQLVWLVRDDAVEDTNYNLQDLTWLWDVTTQDDERIITHNQQGVNSLHYRSGPLSSMEWGISEFYRNYLMMLNTFIQGLPQ